MQLLSLSLSLLLHAAVLLAVLFWPASPPVNITTPSAYQISLVSGTPGGENLPSPVLGPRPPVGAATVASTIAAPPAEALELPGISEAPALPADRALPLPEIAARPAVASVAEVMPVPAMPTPAEVPQAPQIPIPGIPPQIAEPRPREDDPEPRPEPAPLPEPTPEPVPEPETLRPPSHDTQTALAGALAAAQRLRNVAPPPAPPAPPASTPPAQPTPAAQPTPPAATSGQAASRALADLENLVGSGRAGVGGGGGSGIGPGGGGINDVYAGLVILAVQPNWSMATYSRENLSVQVRIRLDAGGRVQSCTIERGSGRADFDASAVNAVMRTAILPEPPTPAQQELIITFNSLQMAGG